MKAAIYFACAAAFVCACGSKSSGTAGNNGATDASSGGAGSGSGGSASGTDASSSGASTSSSGASSSSGGDASSGGDGSSVTPTVGGIFQAPEPWTEDVSGLTKDPQSDAIIAALSSFGGWGNGNKLQIDFSIPLFFGDSSTPQQTVNAPSGGYCYGGPDCDPVPLQMPFPTNGNIEGSANYTCDTANNDCHFLIVQKDQMKLYELYNATQAGSGFTALGAFIWDLTKAYPPNLRGDQCTSADAAGFPIAGLLPTADEVAAGAVNHSLRFILPNAYMKMGVYVHPASHAGGPSSTNANAPPYGVRLRLNASFDGSSYTPGAQIILAAMKKYGMLLSDGGNIALTFADDRTTTAKWASEGITAQTFNSIGVNNFEVVAFGPDITLTDNCVRNP